MIEETLCPKCSARMISRLNSVNKTRFWGCSRFPKCTGTRNIDGEAMGTRADEESIDDRLPSEKLRDASRSRWRDE